MLNRMPGRVHQVEGQPKPKHNFDTRSFLSLILNYLPIQHKKYSKNFHKGLDGAGNAPTFAPAFGFEHFGNGMLKTMLKKCEKKK